MKVSLPIRDKYPFLISLGLHGLILLIFALISLNVKPETRWHQFEWLVASEPKAAASPFPSSNEGAPQAAARASKPAKAVSGQESHSFHDIESPLLESPTQVKPKIQTTPVRESPLSPALNSAANTAAGDAGTAGFSYSMLDGGSDAYFIRETKPKITPLEDDVVIVEFSLSANGRVNMNSLNVISYRRAAHWEALRKEMGSWIFGFTGAYKPEQLYRIRCNFTLR